MLDLEGKAGINHKGQYSLVFKAYVDAVVVGGAVDFNKVHGLAHDLIEAVEAPAIIAVDSGFAALGDDGLKQGWKFSGTFSVLLLLAGTELRQRNGAFTFNSSHVALLGGDLVRARSVLVTSGAAR